MNSNFHKLYTPASRQNGKYKDFIFFSSFAALRGILAWGENSNKCNMVFIDRFSAHKNKKMRYYFIIFMTFALLVDLKSQANIYNDYHGQPDPTAPKFVRQVRLMILDTCYVGYYVQNYTDTILTDICIERYKSTNIYDDSSRVEMIWIEKGPKINNKRFGTWIVDFGSNSWIDYYFNDYKIIKGDITESILVDFKDRSAVCNFTYFNYIKNINTKMKIEFSISDNGIVYAKCITSKGNDIFKVEAKYLIEEIKLLFTGYYDRKIYAH